MEETLKDFNFFDPNIIEDPYGFFEIARREAPVYRLPDTDMFLVTRYDLVLEAVKRPEDFSNKFSRLLEGKQADDPEVRAILEEGWPQVDTLLTNDPPEHKRFRALVNKAFTAKRVDQMEGYITEVVDRLIDSMVDKGECDFVADFAVPLPVTVIADQLGVPREDIPLVKEWSDAFADRLGGMISRERELETARQVVDFQKYMCETIKDRRANPKDDIVSDLVHAREEGERSLDDTELLNVIQQLLVAGNETTTNALAGGMLLLLRHPDQMERLREKPDFIANMVEEVLRMESPTAGMWRIVTRDTTLGGVPIPAGAKLFLRFDAANRDPEKFEDGERFNIERRNAKTHLAFGQGIHFCVGAMLARKEMNVAFRQLLSRLKSITLQPGRNDFLHHPNIMLRGLKHLYIQVA
ncbi:MAG: cytochrome P450 [Alphaproteobacteria bacterium]|nr:MAG: cytochrome P450 [Alphaproteobacteria bacterium]